LLKKPKRACARVGKKKKYVGLDKGEGKAEGCEEEKRALCALLGEKKTSCF